jgi:hypothetical protein
MADCYYCGEEIPGIPVTAEDDPLRRQWCSEDHRDASSEREYEQHYRPAPGDPDSRGPYPGWKDSPGIPRFGADENDIDYEVTEEE